MERSLVELIAHKRDGHALSAREISRIVEAFTTGALADYQMAALLMAVYFRGLSDDETTALTQAMLHSGRVVDLAGVPGLKVDKHSTGGVGDKVSLCLAPLVAACGVAVPMVCGRGLGHTGGTLDKLEAIAGFRTDLSIDDFVRIVGEVGTCMMGQTRDLAPADKRMYALRDVTGTVESIPLIVASILSKKLAEGIDGLVLDVKVGRGAFMKTEAEARALAERLVSVGKHAGKNVVALVTNMDVPLGRTVGNSLETREAIDVLNGGEPDDVIACTMALGSEMLQMAGKASTDEDAREKLERARTNGDGATVFEKMIAAQGGDPRVVREPDRLGRAPVIVEIRAECEGYVVDVDPRELGLSAVALGAGRTRADATVDPLVGIELAKTVGDGVNLHDVVARVHARSDISPGLVGRIAAAFRYGEARPPSPQLIKDRIA